MTEKEVLMKAGVKWPTFPHDEYLLRIAGAKKCLQKHNLDAMLLFSPTNWYYYGGFTDAAQMHNDVWRSCLIISQQHDPVAVIHQLEGMVRSGFKKIKINGHPVQMPAVHGFTAAVFDVKGLLFRRPVQFAGS